MGCPEDSGAQCFECAGLEQIQYCTQRVIVKCPIVIIAVHPEKTKA